ncbi:putative ripening-related protein 7 [Aegilops tauschii subsp. strangulata]|uniref:Uncharacterized protein n=1 Tax=Aegilops tauschii TaxID=37682 RepID=R7WAX3_AEGTA|nr:putative ripening-related protein 7 [Aegilops tauschii subsp. strangulata]
MANTTKVIAILGAILVLLQVSSCAAGRHLRDTPALMFLRGFDKGDLPGGWPASCDGKYYNDGLLLASVASQWYAGRCGKMISIRDRPGGRAVEAMVVDECDFGKGCGDTELSTSPAVWKALWNGVDPGVHQAAVTWSDLD